LGSSANFFGFCFPFAPEYFSVAVDSILFALTGTITEPRTDTSVAPQLNSITAPAAPTGKSASATWSLAAVSPTFSTPRTPSRDFVTTSPVAAPVLAHFSPDRSHPVSVRITPPTVLGPVYSPLPISPL